MAIVPTKADEDEVSVFARPSFYAEFAPREDQAAFVDSIYILKDRGRLTEGRISFASPLKELAFIFRKDGPGGKVVFNEPSLDYRRKARAFFGWIVGVKFKRNWSEAPSIHDPAIVACRDALARVVRDSPSCFDILDTMDLTLLALARQARHGSIAGRDPLDAPHGRVSDLANHVGKSVRTTLQRRVRTSTGCPPRRFLAMQRFRRSVYEIAAGGDGLSVIAFDLGFSDQAHLTREFRRHAGVTPGAFRQAWCRPRAQAVRFLQDAERSTRLMMAVWPLGTTTEAG